MGAPDKVVDIEAWQGWWGSQQGPLGWWSTTISMPRSWSQETTRNLEASFVGIALPFIFADQVLINPAFTSWTSRATMHCRSYPGISRWQQKMLEGQRTGFLAGRLVVCLEVAVPWNPVGSIKTIRTKLLTNFNYYELMKWLFLVPILNLSCLEKVSDIFARSCQIWTSRIWLVQTLKILLGLHIVLLLP